MGVVEGVVGVAAGQDKDSIRRLLEVGFGFRCDKGNRGCFL